MLNYVHFYMVCVPAFCSQIGILCVVVSGIMYTAIENLGRECGVSSLLGMKQECDEGFGYCYLIHGQFMRFEDSNMFTVCFRV